jgi:hypothetical protein
MTKAQADWLRQNPDYQIVNAGGISSSGAMTIDTERYKGMGALDPDGTFRPRTKAIDPALLVGKRKPPAPPPGERGALTPL